MSEQEGTYAQDLRNLIVVDTELNNVGYTTMAAATIQRLERRRGWLAEVPKFQVTDAGRAAIRQALEPDTLTASEALFGFMGWLTARQQITEFGVTKDAAIAVELVSRFMDANQLADCRDNWATRLLHPVEPPPPAPVHRTYERGNVLLIGRVEEIDLVRPDVGAMIKAGGFWLAGDTNRPDLTVPLAVINGEIWCMQLDCVLDPERFLDTLTLAGPFHPAGGVGDIAGTWEKEHG